MGVLTFFILATYAAQIIQIYFFAVPSAGSTVEMLFKVKKDPARANCHPAAAAIRSRFKMTVLILATLTVTTTSLIPLFAIVYPPIFKLLRGEKGTSVIYLHINTDVVLILYAT